MYSCQDAFVVDASDYSSHLIRHLLNASEAFPTEWFLQFWEQAKSVGLMSGLYGGWGSTCNPYFSKISDTAPEVWGRALWWKMRTPAANMADFSGESLDAKHLAETFCSMPLLQWTPEALCCHHSILVISHTHLELNFRLLAATFFSGGANLHASTERTEISAVVQNLVSMSHLWQQFCSNLLTCCLVAPQQFFCDPLASCLLLFAQLMRNPFSSDFSLLQCLSHDSENRSGWHVCFMRNFFAWFASIFFQQGADDNLRCIVRCCNWPPASWVVLDAYPTVKETRCPPWHRATIHYTVPTKFM